LFIDLVVGIRLSADLSLGERGNRIGNGRILNQGRRIGKWADEWERNVRSGMKQQEQFLTKSKQKTLKQDEQDFSQDEQDLGWAG
jgi:hypothetical protein